MIRIILAGAAIALLTTSCQMKTGNEVKKEEQKQMDIKQDINFPLETSFTNDYLVKNFWKANYDSAGEKLAYYVILPKNVKATKVEPELVKTLGLTIIGQYSTIDQGAYMEVQVAYESLSTKIQPSEWLGDKLKTMNETILKQHLITAKNGEKYLDVLTAKKMKDGNDIISRLTVLKSDLNYFTIKTSCARKDYKSLAGTMQHISSNWGLKS
ncbi:hypothetical protein HDF26_003132 [Pedobacter cryoconitis]|uniref:hypothetical protein n=1 Tax=Pedobacter cryoconitis TaxID=188932 RepID=UPI0016134B4E|nr:hypothetical protein [Pedobacter cryoconitis]MBB6272675.1 hypothetical protein [Pedobacter cryoconitis]